MKAVILSAGFGMRLKPLTYYINKGMVPVAGRPILEHILLKLKKQGFSDFLIAISILGEQVINYFDSGRRHGIRIAYSWSEKPFGTAGEMFRMRKLLAREKNFLVHYGDILTDLDAAGMARFHLRHGGIATIGLVTGVPIHFGVGRLDKKGRLIGFEEKPKLLEAGNAAVQIFNRKALPYMKKGEDIATHAVPRMIACGEKVMGFLDRKAYWQDVGRLSDLDDANKLLNSLKKPR